MDYFTEFSSGAEALHALRLKKGLTQDELAELTGINQPRICALEKGKKVIGVKVAKKLAGVFEVDYRLFM